MNKQEIFDFAKDVLPSKCYFHVIKDNKLMFRVPEWTTLDFKSLGEVCDISFIHFEETYDDTEKGLFIRIPLKEEYW